MESIEKAKEYLRRMYEDGDSPWLEGWICGFTDPIHYSDEESSLLYDELFNLLNELREGRI